MGVNCYVRRNTKGVVLRLEQLGFSVLFSARNNYGAYLVHNNGTVYGTDVVTYESGINCGIDSELFIALASMNKDTDLNQYFVLETNMAWVNQETYLCKGTVFKCLVSDRYMGEHPDVTNMIPPARRATEDEVIKFFKDRRTYIKCFIRKNTPELRLKLSNFGIFICRCAEFPDWDWLSVNKDSCHGIAQRGEFGENVRELLVLEEPDTIDCGTNEDLLFALLNIEEVTDLDQYFYYDGKVVLCECMSRIDMWGDFEEGEVLPRKATIPEIVEYFNNK